MDITNVFRTGMDMSISRFHIWLCNIYNECVSITSTHEEIQYLPL